MVDPLNDLPQVLVVALSPVLLAALIALLAWLLKGKLDQIHVGQSANTQKLDLMDARLDGIDVLMARQDAAGQVDQAHREVRQHENDRRLSKVESGLVGLTGEVKRDMGILHGRLDAVLGREHSSPSSHHQSGSNGD